MMPEPYPYPVGAEVEGANCVGSPFKGTVTEILAAWTVVLDGTYVTPTSLIHRQIDGSAAAVAAAEDGPISPPASGQLSLF